MVKLWHSHTGGAKACDGNPDHGPCPFGSRESAANQAFLTHPWRGGRQYSPCECCGHAVFMFDGHQLCTGCMAKHDRHRRGLNASRCKSYGKVSQ